MATVKSDVLSNHTNITAGYLRNGAASAVARTARASSLATKYHFAGVRFDEAFDGNLTSWKAPLPIAFLIDAQIRAAFGQLVESKVQEAKALAAGNATSGASAFDEDATRTAEAARAANRIEAIGLGASHAAGTASYHFEDADFIATENETAIFEFTPPKEPDSKEKFQENLARATGGWTLRVKSGNDATSLTAKEELAFNFPALTEDESELAYRCFSLGQVAPVRAGAQLFISAHHYLSDAASSARCTACEKEVFGGATQAVKDMWNANKQLLRPVIWHSSIHFILVATLEGLAADKDIAFRLDATGYGSFAVGLPAQEDLLKRASAYLAVLAACRSTIANQGHNIHMENLTAVVKAVEGVGRDRTEGFPATNTVVAAEAGKPWPAAVDSRPSMLKYYLEPACVAAEPVAAWVFGFYKEICDDASIRANSEEGSLLRSWSLRRAAQNHLGEHNNGMQNYTAYKKFLKAQAADGNLEVKTLAA